MDRKMDKGRALSIMGFSTTRYGFHKIGGFPIKTKTKIRSYFLFLSYFHKVKL